MPKLNRLPPSKESKQTLIKPITVVSRSISAHSIIDRHLHDWGQFLYSSKGVLAVTTDNDRLLIPPEQCVWIPPGEMHEVVTMTDVELSSFYISAKLLHKLPSESVVLKVNEFLKVLIREANHSNNDYQWDDSHGLLVRLILDKLASAPEVSIKLPYPKDARLLTMLDMIQQDPGQNRTLEQWGKIVGGSARTLSRLFKSQTGLSYSQWRQRLNVQLAIRLLAQDEPVANIASTLGYESPSAFTYMFRQITGVPPCHYREKRQ